MLAGRALPRPSRTILVLALALAVLVAGLAAGDAGAAKLRPAKTLRDGRAMVFKPRHSLATDRVTRVRLIHHGRRKGLSVGAFRSALQRRGKVITKVPKSWVPHASTRKPRVVRHKRKLIARRTKLEVSIGQAERPAPAAAIPSGLRVGLVTNAQGWGTNSQSILDQTTPLGVHWLREDFQWSTIEPSNDSWDFSRYDHLLLEAAARNIRILPVLIDTPRWAGASWNTIPADPAQYADYVAKVTGRYGPGGSFWQAHPEVASFAPDYFELWNEPYLSAFSAGGVDAGRYAKLVRAASTAGRAANPQAKFLLAAEQTPAGDARHTFIDDMYAAVPDLNSYFDAVAVHPYPGSSAPDDPRGGWGFPRLADIHQKLVDHGASDKPLWLTEIGWSTCPASPDYCTTEANQAAYIAQMFTLLSTKYSSYVGAVFLYHRTDLNSNPSDKEGWFGLERLDGSHKPAFDVVRAAAAASA